MTLPETVALFSFVVKPDRLTLRASFSFRSFDFTAESVYACSILNRESAAAALSLGPAGAGFAACFAPVLLLVLVAVARVAPSLVSRDRLAMPAYDSTSSCRFS